MKSSSDFDIPAKRRLLSRPDTFVYVGDVCELLAALDVLDGPVDTGSDRVAPPELPQRLLAVVGEGLLASSDVNVCVEGLGRLLREIDAAPPYDRAQFGRLMMFTKAVIDHTRDRSDHEAIAKTVAAIADKFNADGLRLGVLACELRPNASPDAARLARMLAACEGKPTEGAAELLESVPIIRQRG